MASLALTQTGLQNEASYMLGYGRTYSAASTSQKADVDACVQAGLRAFYWPENAYRWTFLEPQASLSVTAGARVFDLPTDFSSIVGDISWPATSTSRDTLIRVVSEAKIRELIQGITFTNTTPRFAAIINKSAGVGATFSVEFDNYFDDAYSLAYTYRVMPNSDSTLYGVGAHSETILASVLAAAEQRIDSTEQSYRQDFVNRLKASLAIDMELRPSNHGSYYENRNIPYEDRHQSTGIPTFYRNGAQV